MFGQRNLSFFLQISMVARKGKNDQSFVTIDEFVFLQTPLCNFQPEAAKPTDAPPTTPPTTTPEPTEPPDREILFILFCSLLKVCKSLKQFMVSSILPN